MKFKDAADEQLFNNPPDFVDMTLFGLLRKTMQIVDFMSDSLGFGEVLVTCYIAPRAYESQHPKGLAVDIRCHQTGPFSKPLKWYWGMDLLGKTLHSMDGRITFIMHKGMYGKPNEHVHIHTKEVVDEKA